MVVWRLTFLSELGPDVIGLSFGSAVELNWTAASPDQDLDHGTVDTTCGMESQQVRLHMCTCTGQC